MSGFDYFSAIAVAYWALSIQLSCIVAKETVTPFALHIALLIVAMSVAVGCKSHHYM